MSEKDPLTEPWKHRGMDQLCSKLHPEADKGRTDAGDRLQRNSSTLKTETILTISVSVCKPAHRGIRLGWSHLANCSQFNCYSMKRATKSSFRVRFGNFFREKKNVSKNCLGGEQNKSAGLSFSVTFSSLMVAEKGKKSKDKYVWAWIETQRDPVFGMQFLRSSAPLTLWARLNLVRWLSGAPSVAGGKQEASREITPGWFTSHTAGKLKSEWTAAALKISKNRVTVDFSIFINVYICD